VAHAPRAWYICGLSNGKEGLAYLTDDVPVFLALLSAGDREGSHGGTGCVAALGPQSQEDLSVAPSTPNPSPRSCKSSSGHAKEEDDLSKDEEL
jgi:hypothetical protein